MEIPSEKFDHHKFEGIVHVGFLETLDRCAGKDNLVDFDTPEFVQCVKASGINYGTFARNWLSYNSVKGKRVLI